MPDELWKEVRDIVQETGIKTMPMEEKCKKAKWLSGEALQMAVKRREAKSKGEKERSKHLNAEFIKKNTFESVLMRWMKLEPIIQSEVSQKEKHQYSKLMHIYGI